jgi:hypothetical protein
MTRKPRRAKMLRPGNAGAQIDYSRNTTRTNIDEMKAPDAHKA